jgi:hypothetical protein
LCFGRLKLRLCGDIILGRIVEILLRDRLLLRELRVTIDVKLDTPLEPTPRCRYRHPNSDRAMSQSFDFKHKRRWITACDALVEDIRNEALQKNG